MYGTMGCALSTWAHVPVQVFAHAARVRAALSEQSEPSTASKTFIACSPMML
jgi:hypothetical protein